MGYGCRPEYWHEMTSFFFSYRFIQLSTFTLHNESCNVQFIVDRIFGAITRIVNIVCNREDLLKLAAAGPLAGFSFGFVLLLLGFILPPSDGLGLVIDPTVFHESFLVGGLGRHPIIIQKLVAAQGMFFLMFISTLTAVEQFCKNVVFSYARNSFLVDCEYKIKASIFP